MSRDTQFDSLLPPLRLDRRGFVVTALASGFTLATGHVAAATAIATSSEGLTAGPVRIPAQGGDMPAYRAAPAGASGLPVVLVASEIFGVHEYIQDVCRRLAHAGYLAIAPELFARQGDPSGYTEIGRLRSEVIEKVPDAQVMADLDAAAAWAAQHGADPKRLMITGFCWGGRIVWLYAAHNRDLRAGAAWYGHFRGTTSAIKPVDPIDVLDKLAAPVIGLYGEADSGIPVADVEFMRDALADGSPAAQASVIQLYKEAPHGFHADYRPSYRQDAAEDGWRRMLDWFKQHGG
ncbi:dienelactone hydrolase family protein [Bordetella petrii]|uniref:dienelactone hydrolase family protein n=1 Tax=Bordetella petrii TaxID=94624 RepID=UPI003733195D